MIFNLVKWTVITKIWCKLWPYLKIAITGLLFLSLVQFIQSEYINFALHTDKEESIVSSYYFKWAAWSFIIIICSAFWIRAKRQKQNTNIQDADINSNIDTTKSTEATQIINNVIEETENLDGDPQEPKCDPLEALDRLSKKDSLASKSDQIIARKLKGIQR